MAKGHVTPHFMLGRTPWQQPGLSPQDMRHTGFSGFQRGSQGVPKQSPRGQKLLERNVPPSPYSVKVVPTSSGSAQAATAAAIPYYDPNTVVPFIARFGDAPARVAKSSCPRSDSQRLDLSPWVIKGISSICATASAIAIISASVGFANEHMNEFTRQLNRAGFYLGHPLKTASDVHMMSFVNMAIVLGPTLFVIAANLWPDTEQNKTRTEPKLDLSFFTNSALVSLGLGGGAIGLTEMWPFISSLLLIFQGFNSALWGAVITGVFIEAALESGKQRIHAKS